MNVTNDELMLAKIAAEQVYTQAIDEANEKIAFARELMAQATEFEKIAMQKLAEDNGPGTVMPYIDQLHTPAGAATVGAGAGVQGVIGSMRNVGQAVGAGAMQAAGALTAFIDQHRFARAQEVAAQTKQAGWASDALAATKAFGKNVVGAGVNGELTNPAAISAARKQLALGAAATAGVAGAGYGVNRYINNPQG